MSTALVELPVALLEYNPRHYDTLPPVMEAGRNAEPSGAIKALDSVIGEIFVKHGVEKELGIILLHNHFELSPSEILVQFGNSAVPWNTTNNPDTANVVAGAWRFVSEGLAPYQFVYSIPNNPNPALILNVEQHGGFLTELRAVLTEYNLIDVLGLVLLDDKDVDSEPLVEIESGARPLLWKLISTLNLILMAGFMLSGSLGLRLPVVFKKHKIAYKYQGDYHGSRHLTTNL
ncbi:hypothetical protein AA313_de0205744 [Arthrobotrys entomopaga]|nr:hypothetical protein AA313_de0205744 [Arthrobotrys entomopaga]